jgi:hypothetical protein
MNDLELLQRWGRHLDPPGETPPPSVRARVLRREPARSRRTPRIALSLSLSAALAVTGVVVGFAHVPGPDAPPAKDVTVSADQILRNAAVLVARQTEVTPRADQFVFTESVFAGTGLSIDANGKATQTPAKPQVRQVWESADGTRDGLIKGRSTAEPDWTFTDTIYVCHDGKMHGEKMACLTVPHFLPGLPTDADAMLTYLYTRPEAKAAGADKNVAAFAEGLELFDRYYLTPAVKAAVFEALSHLPGVTMQRDVVDLAGRHGVAVRMTPPTMPGPDVRLPAGEFIFDPKTYAFLGTTDSAILREAIVDKPGEMP